jgi:hypothetical protein
MRALTLTILAALAAASTAVAQPKTGPNDAAVICLDGAGVSHPAVCSSHSATRFAQAPDICHCNGPWRHVIVPWCAQGERPPNDTAAYDRARIEYAEKNKSSLFGGTFEGQRMCVPLNSPSGY